MSNVCLLRAAESLSTDLQFLGVIHAYPNTELKAEGCAPDTDKQFFHPLHVHILLFLWSVCKYKLYLELLNVFILYRAVNTDVKVNYCSIDKFGNTQAGTHGSEQLCV